MLEVAEPRQAAPVAAAVEPMQWELCQLPQDRRIPLLWVLAVSVAPEPVEPEAIPLSSVTVPRFAPLAEVAVSLAAPAALVVQSPLQ